MKLVEEIKSHSSKWIKSKGPEYSNFYWQDGYAAFSVNPRGIERVPAYIRNQKDHHRKKSFQDELRGTLIKYQIEFDERYVWE